MTYSEILNSDNGKKQNVIYKFENLANGKIYIGQTKKKLRERLAQHVWQSKNKPNYFHKALNKYGIANFDITILEESEDSKLLDGLEVYWISYYDSTNRDKGYNRTIGGSGIRSTRPKYSYEEQEVTRIKRSQSAKNKWKSEEYRNRYKNSRKEYKKVIQLDFNLNIIKIFSSINEAERYIFGKKTNKLWEALCKNNLPQIEFNNCIWKLYNTCGNK